MARKTQHIKAGKPGSETFFSSSSPYIILNSFNRIPLILKPSCQTSPISTIPPGDELGGEIFLFYLTHRGEEAIYPEEFRLNILGFINIYGWIRQPVPVPALIF
jgi:hypothetical protein